MAGEAVGTARDEVADEVTTGGPSFSPINVETCNLLEFYKKRVAFSKH